MNSSAGRSTRRQTPATLGEFMARLKRHNPGQREFRQAVCEAAADIIPFIADKPIYRESMVLERLTEPDRIIIFRVGWEDDHGNVRANRGYRIQHNNAIGPYKGGIRFHRDLNLDTLRFLAFEQTLKNSLTGLPMGGAKGGANFNPKGKSETEVMRFCQSFMIELSRYIGPNIDIPAGDIGVREREISYMFGQYKRLTNEFSGVITGKGISFGGSLIRTEATGYGCVYMLENMLKLKGETIDGKTALVSGAGNVAQSTIEKLLAKGARVLTVSDSSGFVHDPGGIDREKLEFIKFLVNVKRGRIAEFAEAYHLPFYHDRKPWGVPADIAIPCATQNEISLEDARTLLANGCIAVVEAANMPTVQEGVDLFLAARILYAPSKAANAGGVAVSGLEMTQNSMRMSWSREELEAELLEIMDNIHEKCLAHGSENGYVNYRKGANIAGFLKVADAVIHCGLV